VLNDLSQIKKRDKVKHENKLPELIKNVHITSFVERHSIYRKHTDDLTEITT